MKKSDKMRSLMANLPKSKTKKSKKSKKASTNEKDVSLVKRAAKAIRMAVRKRS